MALWDRIFGKKDEDPRKMNPIVQKNPPPAAAARVSHAKPAAKPAPPPPKLEAPPQPEPEKVTKNRKKKSDTGLRPADAAAFLKRGLARQQKGDHAGAIEDFTKAIEVDESCAQAYASRGVSREQKGDHDGAKSDYSKSIQIEITNEISRQIRDNPEVDV